MKDEFDLTKKTAKELEALGWTIDRTTYPWTAYQGGRFNPTKWFCCPTPAYKPKRAATNGR